VKELLADAFVVMRDFIASELNCEPIDLLGEETWKTLLEVATVYSKELEECNLVKSQVNWGYSSIEQTTAYLRCSNCASELLKPINPGETTSLHTTFVAAAVCPNAGGEIHDAL
jgi:hypothetical protein